MTKKELEQEIIKYINENQLEFYYNYDDSLSNEQIETIIKEDEGLNNVENEICNFNNIYSYELEQGMTLDVSAKFSSKLAEFYDDCEEAEEYITNLVSENISIDINIKELLCITGKQIFFYDTGVEFDGYPRTDKEHLQDIKKLKKTLSIKDTKYDDVISMMLHQASYGGQLVVYFRDNIYNVHEGLSMANTVMANTITFSDAHIAIIDTGGGSGDDCYIKGHSFSLPFSRDNLQHEKSIHYNYTYDVCGMVPDWCKSTYVEFSKTKSKKKAAVSSLNAIQELDKQYDKTFKEGGCTIGDMNITRHRDVIYINNYPCGNKCTKCGTFWID